MTDSIKRTRVHSARPLTDRQRPLSSKLFQLEDKTQFIQKIYYNSPGLLNRPASGKQKVKINSFNLTNNAKYKDHRHEKEALLQQNMLLKKKINILDTQMSLLHGKLQTSRSKNSKIKKTLNIQFQNQSLWTGPSAYLVTGVKNQYEKLKAQYRQKCEQLNQIKQVNQYLTIQQLQKQNQYLQDTSNRLIKKIVLLEKRDNFSASSSFPMNRSDNFLIEEMKEKLSQKEEKLMKKNEQISALQEALENDKTRVKFLQKLAIEKDNALHALYTKNKKLQKQREVFIEKIQSLQKRIDSMFWQNEQKIKNLQEAQERKVNRQRQIYSKVIDERNQTILKLEKEVAYLTTLMSYWKPLDEDNKRPKSPQRHIINVQTQKTQQDKNKKSLRVNDSLGLLGRAFSQRFTDQSAIIKQKTQQVLSNHPREQKRADVKRSLQAKKVRRVKESEVQEIGQLIKYRLIAQRISINQAKSYFSKEVQSQQPEETQVWQSEYITMKEAYETLLQSPFNLTQTQAHLLSRYMIEDVMNDYIYCDWDNENKRQVVKSILKNTVKEYEVNETLEQIEAQTSAEMDKYKTRISTMLQQLFKDVVIPKKKLMDVFVGSGLQIKQSVVDFIIGQLAMKSDTLEKLDYSILF